MKYLEPNELKKLLDTTRSADDHNALRDWTILTVAYRHAMRAEEISNLTFKDVDLKSNTIRIRRVKGSLESIQPIEAAPGPPTTSGQDTLAITCKPERLFTLQKTREPVRTCSRTGRFTDPDKALTTPTKPQGRLSPMNGELGRFCP